MSRPSLVWFRRDLRLEDHPALCSAISRGEAVIPIYIHDPQESSHWPAGGATCWWLHHSLSRLNQQLKDFGSKLVIRSGDTRRELLSIIQETDAAAIYWTRRYEPDVIDHDTRLEEELNGRGIHAESSNGQLLFEPWEIETKEGRPYQVFTSFWKMCLTRPEPDSPEPAPEQIPGPTHWPQSLTVDELELEPKIRWDSGLKATWKPGAESANDALAEFLKRVVGGYSISRDQPAIYGTSRLSPHLHFGEISPRTIWHETSRRRSKLASTDTKNGCETFLKEIGWREFSHHLIYHFPDTNKKPLRPDFAQFPWRNDKDDLRAWQKGRTGFPIVDAGMRQLWTTGWMHNRVRMITASFLVKDLLIPWLQGAEWFWDTLVDADLSNNTLNWQWSAGCGADAAPYFRVFNPTLQSKKFDPSGEYIHRWIPELKNLKAPWLHEPWSAPEEVLKQSGVKLGENYPHPIVDHDDARQRALSAFAKIKKTKS